MASEKLASNSDVDIQQALSLAREGETELLGVLLSVYRNYLLFTANRRLSRSVSAKVAPSDLVQDALMNALRSIDHFHGTTEAELRVWLKQILLRKVFDTHRYYHDLAMRDVSREVPFLNRNGGARVDLAAEPSTPLTSMTTERLRKISEILDCLTPEQRQAIQFRTFERLSFEAVGKKLGRTEEAARKIWTRAIQKMTLEFRSHESKSRSGFEQESRSG